MSLDNIAKRAEAYKPKERVTYKMIKKYIEAKYIPYVIQREGTIRTMAKNIEIVLDEYINVLEKIKERITQAQY